MVCDKYSMNKTSVFWMAQAGQGRARCAWWSKEWVAKNKG